VGEQALRQGKRAVVLDRDVAVLNAARTRWLQRYHYLKTAGLLPPHFTTADTLSGDQSAFQVTPATEAGLKQVHWVEEVQMGGLDDRSIPKSNLPETRCEHPIIIKRSLLVDDEEMEFAPVSN